MCQGLEAQGSLDVTWVSRTGTKGVMCGRDMGKNIGI